MHLKPRVAHLGVIHNRTEKHGDDEKPAIDVPVLGFALNAEEFNALLNNPFAHRALFDTSKNPAEPIFSCFKPLALTEKFHQARVAIHLGLGNDLVELDEACLAKAKFTPATGGMVSMDVTVQRLANLADVPKLLAFQGHEVDVEFDVDPSAKPKETQQSLPLDEEGESDEDERDAA